MLRAVSTVSDYLGAYAWASLPAAASFAGYRARVTDYGVNLIVISDGTRWVPFGVQILGRSAVASSVTGTTANTTLATVNVPAGLMGINGGLRIAAYFTTTNSANNKTMTATLGGQQIRGAVRTTSANQVFWALTVNRGVANSQHIYNMVDGVVTAQTPITVDTTAAQSVLLQAQLALGTETITLESYTVEVLP